MRFKLLHVRPHIWLFKQQETLATKATNDDSSSTEGPSVYKRSTSLKLVKSEPSAENSCNGSSSPLDGKSISVGTAILSKPIRKRGKNVQVCTVVDAGCTCRATVTSQHKQKRGPGSSIVGSRDAGNLHDVCRPRRSQILETKGEKDDVVAPKHANLHAKSTSSSLRSPGTNGSMVSRLVCKSSHDVIKHAQLDVEQNHVICTSSHDEGTQPDAIAGQVRNAETSAMPLDVHDLECRLRNAGLEEKRRSSRKKNKLSYYEEDSLTGSEVSSSLGTSANTDTVITNTTSEMQDMLVNSNPAFDMDVPTPCSRAMSLDDLRASIAQRKLANLSPQASLHTENVGLIDGLRENSALAGSPSSFSSENIRSVNAVSPQCMRKANRHIHKEKLEVSIKHVDMGINRRRSLSESNDVSNKELVKQSQRARSNMPSKVKETTLNEATPRRSVQKIDVGNQKQMDGVQRGNAKSRIRKSLTQGSERHGLSRNNIKEADVDLLAVEGHITGYSGSGIGQEKQVVSPSCEIQVLSDYNHDNQSDSSHGYPMLRIHVGGTTSASGGVDAGAHTSEDGAELMTSESAVAMVKSSYDPRHDFKESMLEMVTAKRLRTPRQLQQLLQCYLSLNPQHYHPIIIKVFHDLCSELFH